MHTHHWPRCHHPRLASLPCVWIVIGQAAVHPCLALLPCIRRLPAPSTHTAALHPARHHCELAAAVANAALLGGGRRLFERLSLHTWYLPFSPRLPTHSELDATVADAALLDGSSLLRGCARANRLYIVPSTLRRACHHGGLAAAAADATLLGGSPLLRGCAGANRPPMPRCSVAGGGKRACSCLSPLAWCSLPPSPMPHCSVGQF